MSHLFLHESRRDARDHRHDRRLGSPVCRADHQIPEARCPVPPRRLGQPAVVLRLPGRCSRNLSYRFTRKSTDITKPTAFEIIVHHSDSYGENLVPFMIEMGMDVWQGCMSTNNIPEIIKKYGGKLTIMGRHRQRQGRQRKLDSGSRPRKKPSVPAGKYGTEILYSVHHDGRPRQHLPRRLRRRHGGNRYGFYGNVQIKELRPRALKHVKKRSMEAVSNGTPLSFGTFIVTSRGRRQTPVIRSLLDSLATLLYARIVAAFVSSLASCKRMLFNVSSPLLRTSS